ncbi:MAG: DUF1232 domain-containing protein [Bdellovibrionales bacterium]|nr:YkvA family protein [Bdellovibrionales bacterium]NQZ18065.1 DUF1232 domain-containing protein [Bdellovibrionales bacterium]
MNWDKIRKYSQKAGQEVLAVAEAGFLTFKDPKVSKTHKTILLGSLVYLLSPLDGIPDFLPGGFVDDMSVLIAALSSTGFIGKEHLKACRQKRGLTQKEEINGSNQETPKK